MKKTFYFLLLFLTNEIILPQNNCVLLLTIDGSINPAAAEYIQQGIDKAAELNAECVIIELNTPGGLLKSTRVIVTSILESKTPIIVYVFPPGAQAASAGVFISLSAHIAVMAPGTNIGAAHPVAMQGQQDSIMAEKATNDAAAFIRSISEKRNRNVQWAENAVRKSISITEKEALEFKVIDLVADDLHELLDAVDGKIIDIGGVEKSLNTKGAKIIEQKMNFAQQLLNIICDPNIAYILLLLGIYGLFFELYNPGSILPGVVGVISLVLAFYSLHTLPVNYAGVALVIFAVILFVLEIKIVSHGILTIGGIISLIIGSLMLIDVQSALEVMELSWEVIVIFVALTVLFFVFALGFGIKAQLLKTSTGEEGMIGMTGEVIEDLSPSGLVKIHGEIWQALTSGQKIEKGNLVVVTNIDKLKIYVKKSV